MRRCTTQKNGHTAGSTNEFHLDVSPVPVWPGAPMQIQLLPANLSAHHLPMDNLINTSGEQLDQPAYLPNFVYPPSAQASPFNSNGTVYFAHPASAGAQPAIPPTHFHQYHSTHPFESAAHHQFHLPAFQSAPLFQPVPPSGPSTSNNHQSHDTSPTEFQPRYRHPKPADYDKKFSQPRPMSGDFERLHNTHQPPSRFNNDNRAHVRPQSFYDFSNSSSSSNNNFFRSFNNNRFQRTSNNNNNSNNNTSLPLSAYMNADDSLHENETNNNNNSSNHWGASYQRRRSGQQQQQPAPQRAYHQDKHQFPLSSYDPRQYGFHNNFQRRNNFSTSATNANRRGTITSRPHTADAPNPNEIDLIEEWWEDNNTDVSETTTESKAPPTSTTVNDSGNSSLSTSMHLKESISDDSSANDLMNPPSDVSTTDSHIIESLDKLQQQLKLEEAVDERLAAAPHTSEGKDPTPYDTAHFMQWAKEKFREELAGRLTAKEIEQHDAVTTDDEDEHAPATNGAEPMDALEDDLHEKLIIDEKRTSQNPSIAVE